MPFKVKKNRKISIYVGEISKCESQSKTETRGKRQEGCGFYGLVSQEHIRQE